MVGNVLHVILRPHRVSRFFNNLRSGYKYTPLEKKLGNLSAHVCVCVCVEEKKNI